MSHFKSRFCPINPHHPTISSPLRSGHPTAATVPAKPCRRCYCSDRALPSLPLARLTRCHHKGPNRRIFRRQTMVAITLPQNSSLQLGSSFPQKTQYLNRASQLLPGNDVTFRGIRSKENRVLRRLCHAISENETSNSLGGLSKNNNPIIVIDNYDSFTYNLCQYMGELGCNFEVYRNDELTVDELRKKKPRGVLISPGPGAPQDSGISLQTVLELGPDVPLFGVCMGLQCIGEAFGGKIVRSPYGVMHGKSSLVYHNEGGEDGLFAGVSNPFTVGRYHSLVIEKESFPSEALEITAWTEDGLVMAARHKVYRHLVGVQFHPESIITTEGKTIVSNFIKLIESREAVSGN